MNTQQTSKRFSTREFEEAVIKRSCNATTNGLAHKSEVSKLLEGNRPQNNVHKLICISDPGGIGRPVVDGVIDISENSLPGSSKP